jgi:hypothetical protein
MLLYNVKAEIQALTMFDGSLLMDMYLRDKLNDG